jgi:hypothetical protein
MTRALPIDFIVSHSYNVRFTATLAILFSYQTDCADPLNSMYYMVIVQYTARLNPKKLLQVISTLKPENERPPRKRYHFTLAPEQVRSLNT